MKNLNHSNNPKNSSFLTRWLKRLTVYTTVFALVNLSALPYAQAAEEINWVQSMNEVVGKVSQAAIQARKAGGGGMCNNPQKMQMMSRLQPQFVPSKFFPNCPVSKAVTDFPENVCKKENANPMDQCGVQEARSMKRLAASYSSFFDNLMTTGQNSPFPKGIQCLQDNAARKDSEIQDRINALQALADKVKKETQIFKEQNKLLQENMKNLGADLFGPKGKDLDLDGERFKNLFSKNCQDIIGSSKLRQSALKGGLVGLLDNDIGPMQEVAGKTIANRSSLERDVRSQVQRMRTEMDKYGVEVWLSRLGQEGGTFAFSSRPGEQSVKSMQGAIQREGGEFLAEVNRVKALVKEEVGYDVPTLDSNFRADFSDFAQNSEEFFQKKYVNDCVTGSKYGVGLTPDQVLKGLTQNGRATLTSKRYSQALSEILSRDAYIEDKLAAIKRLDTKFGVGNVTIDYLDTNQGRRVKATPYDLYKTNISACVSQMNQDETFSTKAGSGKKNNASMAKKIRRAKDYLNQIKNMEATFANQLAGQVLNDVLNCGGRPLKAGSCSTGTMDSGADGFCVKHAVNCAGQINQCNNQAKAHIEDRKAKLKTAAATYNANVATLVAKQEQFLGQVKNQVLRSAEMIKRFLPKTDYAYPKDLFVKMPELEKNAELGVMLRGNMDLTQIEDLPNQIGKLQELLKGQKAKVKTALAEYSRNQESAMKANKTKWAALKTSCEQFDQAVQMAAAKINEAQQKAFGEAKGKQGEFCQKYNMLRSNPNGFCGSDDFSASSLASEAVKISGSLDSSVMGNLSRIQSICNESNNEASLGTEENEDEVKTDALAVSCRKKGGDYKSIESALVSKAIADAPDDFSKSEIEAYLNGGADFTGEKAKDDFAISLETLRTRLNRAKRSNTVESYKKDAYNKLFNTAPSDTKEQMQTKLDALADSLVTCTGCGNPVDAGKLATFKAKQKADYRQYLEDGEIEELHEALKDDKANRNGGSISAFKPADSFSNVKKSYVMAVAQINTLKTDESLESETAAIDPCQSIKFAAATAAIDKCASSGCDQGQYDDAYDELKLTVKTPASRSLASIERTIDAANVSDIGENLTGPCMAGSTRGRGMGESNPLGLNADILGPDAAAILGLGQ